MGLAENIFGDYTRINKGRIKALVSSVNEYSKWASGLDTESAFLACTNKFRARLRNGETIEDIEVEALSVVREAIYRVLGMYPYDVQIEAALAMNENVIAEMKTGEGKTLVQMLIAYLNLLEATKDEDKSKWKNVHIMTANDALAKRDANQNRKVFELLGFSCGFVPSRKSIKGYTIEKLEEYKKSKKRAYKCDVVYAMASTIAFDYLDDNTIYKLSDRYISRDFGYAIIDEADDLLIDQAINPLRLSGGLNEVDDTYKKASKIDDDFNNYAYSWATSFLYDNNLSYEIYDQHEKNRYVEFYSDYAYYSDTQDVVLRSTIINRLYSGLENIKYKEYMYNLRYSALVDCIRARHSFIKGKQYVVDVKDGKGKIILIDQNTGRRKPSNQYSNGLQEAIEAKEEYFAKGYHIVRTPPEIIKAMCTYPDFISIYEGRVSGMTGTSDADEFSELYNLETYEVESRKPSIRIDEEDRIYATKNEKYKAIINEIIKVHETGEPILIGTTSDNESITISSMLKEKGISHSLLNSSEEERENEIISHAGEKGSVCISTNMAGRGTDIKLGPGVDSLGGLYVIGTSRNNSARVDKQLRGRAGRQGDPGKSVFFVSLEDDLVRMYHPGLNYEELIKKYSGSNKPIKDAYIKYFVESSQKIKSGVDTLSRRASKKEYKVFTDHKNVIYSIRKSFLEAKPKEVLNKILQIIKTYTNIVTEKEEYETITHLLGHLIDVDECRDKNRLKFCDNLNRALCRKLDVPLEGLKGQEGIDYIEKLRTKILELIDIYWVEHIEVLKEVRMTRLSDEKYEIDSNRIFFYELIPSIMNEIITYTAYPKMPFGEYVIDDGPIKKDRRAMTVV